jgi:hypothetical protein
MLFSGTKKCVFLSKTRTFQSDPKLLNGSVYLLAECKALSIYLPCFSSLSRPRRVFLYVTVCSGKTLLAKKHRLGWTRDVSKSIPELKGTCVCAWKLTFPATTTSSAFDAKLTKKEKLCGNPTWNRVPWSMEVPPCGNPLWVQLSGVSDPLWWRIGNKKTFGKKVHCEKQCFLTFVTTGNTF